MACIEKCESCSPSLSIFSILVTADMPVEGFFSLLNGLGMPYKNHTYRDKGNSSQVAVYALSNTCEDMDIDCGCPDGGGWNCYGIAAGTRSQIYQAGASVNSNMSVSITSAGNYKKELTTRLSKNSQGQVPNMRISWQKNTNQFSKTINGTLQAGSTDFCAPAVHVPNPLCGDDYDCEYSCSDQSYTTGGCSNSIGDIAFMPAPTCTTSDTQRTCTGSSTLSLDDNCPGDSFLRQGTLSSEETLSSQVTEAEILSMARDAATKKVNLKKQNQRTDDNASNYNTIDITDGGSCCHFVGECDGTDESYPVNFISDCDNEYDDCIFSSFTKLPTTCNCSKDKDECWTGYSNITIPTEFSYTSVTIGAFKIATNINKEEFSKEYKNVSGTVYFYIDSESEPGTNPCCTACGGIECFTGEIVGTSTYSISSTGFKQNTRVASNDLTYIYDSSELYAIHPGKVIKTCYTVDNLEFF
jgi:hypothetical protein